MGLIEYLNYVSSFLSVIIYLSLFTEILDKQTDTLFKNKLFLGSLILAIYDLSIQVFAFISELEPMQLPGWFAIIFNALFICIYFVKRNYIAHIYFHGLFISYFIVIYYIFIGQFLSTAELADPSQQTIVKIIMMVGFTIMYGLMVYIPIRYLKNRFGFHIKMLFQKAI